ncbi:protein kinase [Streptomyces sp. NPDC093589]|uniref:serine/threonine-protein kinase n=1 Tax=Streptomyces sp. NPDC093589 TaxID=3366043 RepID=UPI00381419BF
MTPGEREQRGADEPGGANGGHGPGGAGATPPEAAPPAGDVPVAAARSGPKRGADADLTGRLLGGRYRVTGQLGRGGMGVVCRCEDEVLGREVAVKVLRSYTDASAPELADLRTRMQREARAAARIRHSGVVTVHDVIDEAGRPVIVMELVDGPSLDDAIEQRGALAPREIARIGAQVMDALDAAHQVGVLHRDVKPGNVLLDKSGRVVLTDFGIASIEAPGDGATTNLTRSGELVGSLDYLPPERAQGQDPTPASDIWSLGMTLYAAVEGGGAPFRRTSVWSTLTAIVTEQLPEPQRAGPLTPVLHALMAKNPVDRPSAAEARGMLEAVAEGREPQTRPAPGAPHLPTATDVRAVAPPPPPQDFAPQAGGAAAAGAAATGGAAPGDAGAPPSSWLSGPGSQGAPATQPTARPDRPVPAAGNGSVPAGGSPAAADRGPLAPGPGYDPPGVTAGPAVGATGPLPGPGESSVRDTARLPARRGRRVALAVAAVLAVLATGGGVTYALVGGGSGDTVAEGGRQSAAPPGKPAPAGEPDATPSKGGDKGDKAHKGKGKGKDSPAPSVSADSPGGEKPEEDPKPGGAGGSSGDQDGGSGGGADGGADGGSGSGGSGGGSGGSGGSGGGSGGSGGGDPTQGPSCVAAGGGKSNCDVWRTATSYTQSFQQVGQLNRGTNYFFCQAKLGRRETYGKWTNVWWAKTDDDSGNSGVYVSVVYLTGGQNDQPVPGLRTC